MLIKYKTEPTIIVLSPNSANLIKILTQFVYSINIRYFSPPPLPCPVTLQGITYKIGAEAKGKYISSPCRAPQHYGVFCTAKYRGGVQRTEGVKKQKGLKKHRQQQNQVPILSPCRAQQHCGTLQNNRKKRLLLNPPPLCFAQQNIGEVAEGRRGQKRIKKESMSKREISK